MSYDKPSAESLRSRLVAQMHELERATAACQAERGEAPVDVTDTPFACEDCATNAITIQLLREAAALVPTERETTDPIQADIALLKHPQPSVPFVKNDGTTVMTFNADTRDRCDARDRLLAFIAEALASSAVPPTQVAASDSQQGEGAVCDTLVPLPGAAATQPSAVPASLWRPAQATKALIDEADDWLQALFDFEVGGNTPTRLERAAVDIIKGLLILVEPDDPPVPLSDQTQDETKRSDAL